MKKMTVLALLGIAVLGLTAVAIANTAARVRADVPFSFYIGKELIPAGEYIFEMRSLGLGASAGSVLIHNDSGSIASVVLTTPGDVRDATMAHLHFNKYGSRYFLSKVEGAGYQANLAPTRAEKEMRVQTKSPAESTIITAY